LYLRPDPHGQGRLREGSVALAVLAALPLPAPDLVRVAEPSSAGPL
jgi:hypothetical protein